MTYPIRIGCSLFLYHILVMETKAGDTAPSDSPKRNLTAANPA